MINDPLYSPETIFFIPDEAETRHKPYRKPHLEELGALRDLTLGGSPGTGDSGGASGTQSPHFATKKPKLILNESDLGKDLTSKKTKPSLKP